MFVSFHNLHMLTGVILLFVCRARASSGSFLERGQDKIIRDIEKKNSRFYLHTCRYEMQRKMFMHDFGLPYGGLLMGVNYFCSSALS